MERQKIHMDTDRVAKNNNGWLGGLGLHFSLYLGMVL